MNEEEARKLLALVCDSYGEEAARAYQLGGNGDWTVRITRTADEDYWLFSFADWKAYRREEKARRKANKQRQEVSV